MNMKKLIFLAAVSSVCVQLCAAEPQKIGVVNLNTCVVDSKLGKQEQNALETLRKQFVSLMEETDKKARDIETKLEDKDYMDGLSKEAEESLRNELAQRQEELGRYQQQFYQFMNQSQYKMFQTIVSGINQAADQIAAAKGFDLIINKESCFFSSPSIDVTADVIKEMDQHFEEAKKNESADTAGKDKEHSGK
jgi:Skp family chaperone for outer membrane proteins